MHRFGLPLIAAIFLGVLYISNSFWLPKDLPQDLTSPPPQMPPAGTPIAAKVTSPVKGHSHPSKSYVTQKQFQTELAILRKSLRNRLAPPSITQIYQQPPAYVSAQSDSIADSFSRAYSTTIQNITNTTVTTGTIRGGSATLDSLIVSGLTTLSDLNLSGSILFSNSLPTDTARRLYVNGDSLYYAGSLIGGATTGTWTSDGTNVWRVGGKVGIGTTSPVAALTVNSNVSAGAPQFALENSFTGGGTWYLGSTDSGNGSGGGRFMINNAATSVGSKFVIDSNGNLGIGTTSPVAKLNIVQDGDPANLLFLDGYVNSTTGTQIVGRKARGTMSVPSATLSNDVIIKVSARGHDGTNFSSGSRGGITISAAENFTSTAQGTLIRFLTVNSGGTTETERVRIDSSGNVGIGTTTPTQKLVVAGNVNISSGSAYMLNGVNVLIASTTRNSYFAGNSGNTTMTGADNTGLGFSALAVLTSGNNNTAIGKYALFNNTDGSSNTANGWGALQYNTSGGYNTASGYMSLSANTSGLYNSGFGTYALNSNTRGEGNTAVGWAALYDANLTSNTAAQNTAIGYNTGRGITTGINNTIIGANVTGLTGSLSNNIIIADGAGNRRINVDANGNVGIGTTSPTAKLDIVGTTGDVLAITNSVGRYTLNAYTLTAPSSFLIDTGGYLSLNAGTQYIQFKTSSNEKMRLSNVGGLSLGAGYVSTDPGAGNMIVSGNVGIGTVSPGGKLHLYQVDPSTGGNILRIQGVGDQGEEAGVTYYAPYGTDSTNRAGRIYTAFDAASFTGARLTLQSMTTGDVLVDTLSLKNGNVGIGTTTPGQKLVVIGNAQITGVTSGAYSTDLNLTVDGTLTTSASDMRLKENIAEISTSTLEKLRSLKAYTFTWKTDPAHRADIGLIAQEVEFVFPELVFTNQTDGFKGVNYSRLSIFLLKGIQEQQVEIEELKKYTTVLKTKELHTEKLCVGIESDEVCITKDELRQILLNAHQSPAAPTPAAPVVAPPAEETSTPETQPVEIPADTSPPVEAPPETPTPESAPTESEPAPEAPSE